MLGLIRFGKEFVGCGSMRKTNRARKSEICSPFRAFSPHLNRRTRKPSVCSPLRVFAPRLNPPSGRDNRICLSSLSQSSFAVLLVPSSGAGWRRSRRPQLSKSLDLRGTRRARVRISKSDSESKPKACEIRADSRWAFSSISTQPPPSRITLTPDKSFHPCPPFSAFR